MHLLPYVATVYVVQTLPNGIVYIIFKHFFGVYLIASHRERIAE